MFTGCWTMSNFYLDYELRRLWVSRSIFWICHFGEVENARWCEGKNSMPEMQQIQKILLLHLLYSSFANQRYYTTSFCNYLFFFLNILNYCFYSIMSGNLGFLRYCLSIGILIRVKWKGLFSLSPCPFKLERS